MFILFFLSVLKRERKNNRQKIKKNISSRKYAYYSKKHLIFVMFFIKAGKKQRG